MTLVIMAAGMGSRYGGLKQIDPVGRQGEFILDYSIYDAIQAGFDKVVFIIKEENLSLFRDTVGKRVEKVIPAEYVFQKVTDVPSGVVIPAERTKPWGTAHAVLCCADAVKDNFAVINADDFYGRDAFRMLGDFLKKTPERSTPSHYCMAGYILANTLTENGHVARGVCRMDTDGFLTSVTERTKIQRNNSQTQYFENGIWTDLPETSTVSMNCWGFTPKLFDAIRAGWKPFFEANKDNLQKAEYFLPSVVTNQINDGSCDVRVLKTTAKWFGVTYHEDRATVVQAISDMTDEGIYPDGLWK